MTLSLAISPCPNDTFIFHAWIAGLLPDAPPVETRLTDIDELNAMALTGTADVTKLSFAAFARVRERYALLHAGGALGRGCGPLVVVRADSPLLGAGEQSALRQTGAPAEARWEGLASRFAGARIAIPGGLTTAALLLRSFLASAAEGEEAAGAPAGGVGAHVAEEAGRLVVKRFDEIMLAVAAHEVDAGVIIHESRFTYPSLGLAALVDLGEWWESTTGHAIPLGGIVVRRDLPRETAAAVERAVRESLLAAWRSPDVPVAFIREHAQEMDEAVCCQHIELYVNDYSLDYGKAGREAIEELLSRARTTGVLEARVDQTPAGAATACETPAGGALPLFWDD